MQHLDSESRRSGTPTRSDRRRASNRAAADQGRFEARSLREEQDAESATAVGEQYETKLTFDAPETQLRTFL